MPLEYWTAKQAAAHLGVNLGTLYAYVSRKGIGSVPMPGTREHRYLRADIERLRRPKTGAKSEPGTMATESAITLISEDGPIYRGRLATELAQTEPLETVASLLWDADLAIFERPPPPGTTTIDRLATVLADEPASHRAMALFPFLEAASPRAFDLTPVGMQGTGVDILRWLTAIVLRSTEAKTLPVHEQFSNGLNLSKELTDLLRRLMVLAADHGFEEATYAVRAVASTGVTPWRSVGAGLAVVTGRSSKFGRNSSLRRLVAEISASADPQQPIISRIKDHEDIPGFTSELYPAGDPRARALLDFCDSALNDDREYQRLRTALRLVYDIKGLHPNFALASVFAEARLGLETRAAGTSLSSTEAPFIVARASGWIAHGIEQYSKGETARRSSRYRGTLPHPF